MLVKKTPPQKDRSRKVLLLVSLLVLVALGAALELTNTTHFFHAAPATSGKIPVITTSKKSTPAPKQADGKAAITPATPADTPKPSDKSNTAPAAGQLTGPVQAPFGSFVSNHGPSLSGSSSLRQEQSVCSTTPGANCTITFTNDAGVVKTLDAQTADGNGAVYWTWDVNDAGFTAGTWKIVATATSKSDSKSTPDQIDLTVKP